MQRLPRHIAIIPDGNGRWATKLGLPRVAGHQRGVEVIEQIVSDVRDRNIPYLTVYAFSDENWQRPSDEVDALMHLLCDFLNAKREKMIRDGVRLRAIGDLDRLPTAARASLETSLRATAQCDRITLILALSYGARGEIARAVGRAVAAGKDPSDPKVITAHLDTAEFPDPDLLIRTSGEYRISNYLLWQMAYTELYFTNTLWPDFAASDLDAAITAFAARERRFGRVLEPIQSPLPAREGAGGGFPLSLTLSLQGEGRKMER